MLDPQNAIDILEDLIAKVEAIPADIGARDFAKIGDDISTVIADATNLYRFGLSVFTPTTKLASVTPGGSPLERLKSALADAKADPAGFSWASLIPVLLALIQSLLPLLHPAPAPVAA